MARARAHKTDGAGTRPPPIRRASTLVSKPKPPVEAPATAPPEGPAIADPGPLGLAAFALTTFVLSMFNAGLIGEAGEPVVFGLALFYGGIVQVLAGMWEFRTGNTFGATAFSSYGAFWLSLWAYVEFYADGVSAAGMAGDAVGIFLLAWGIFTLYMFVASLRTTTAIATVFALLAPTFLVLALGDLTGEAWITKVGGYMGLVTAVGAWYTSFAGVANATFGRIVLPVRPLGDGR